MIDLKGKRDQWHNNVVISTRYERSQQAPEERGFNRIEEDVEGGERSGVQGTPTFFINGVLYRGSWEHDALLAALQAASRTA